MRARKQARPEIVASTEFNRRKRPDIDKNIIMYEPDPEKNILKRKQVAQSTQDRKFADKWAAIKDAAKNL